MGDDFVNQIYSVISHSNVGLDKDALRHCLFEPGNERAKLIRWVLSEWNSHLEKGQTEFDLLLELGMCTPSDSHIVLGKCSEEESLKFWKRLFQFVNLYKQSHSLTPDSASEKVSHFWIALSCTSNLKELLQPPKQESMQPLKEKEDISETITVESLVNEKMMEELKLRELQLEEDVPLTACDISGDKQVVDIKSRVSKFENCMNNSLIPCIPVSSIDLQVDDFNELIPRLRNKVQTLKSYCENVRKIHHGLEAVRNVVIDEPTANDSDLDN